MRLFFTETTRKTVKPIPLVADRSSRLFSRVKKAKLGMILGIALNYIAHPGNTISVITVFKEVE